MNINDAYLKAKEVKTEIDNCTEYENGFVFGCSKDNEFVGGGDHVPVVVLKEDGKVVNLPFFMTRGAGEEIKNFTVSADGIIKEV